MAWPNKPRHGDCGTPEHHAWRDMRGRCNNPKHSSYSRYGGRGISVCERWSVYENFIADMGRRPSPRHSIDRINNDGPYSPENCRWATRDVQNRNTSATKLTASDVLVIRADSRPRSHIAREYGVTHHAIYNIHKRRTWKNV